VLVEDVIVTRRQQWVMALVLMALAALPYLQTSSFDFVNFDDNIYVTENRVVQNGLTWSGIRYAFTTFEGGNWHPFTWLVHMFDHALFGMDAGKHHLVSVLGHAVNTVLLWLLLGRMTAAWWRSALVAALFAIHPMHVESVAWVAERKDVMAALFGFMAMHAYLCYVPERMPKWYLAMLAFFVASLMFKPMLVTLPALLLLVDVWPLRRWATAARWLGPDTGDHEDRLRLTMRPLGLSMLLIEKIPLLAISAAFSVVAVISQQSTKAMTSFDYLSLSARLANSIVAYDEYLRKLLAPMNLAVFYPHPLAWATERVIVGAVALIAVTVLAIWLARRAPWFLTGWLWFLGLLVPVIGLVQVGMQFMADRYTYLPSIGVFIIIAWGLAALSNRLPRWVPVGAAVLIVLVYSVLAHRQAGYWRNSRTLFERAQAVTQNNFKAHQNLGNVLEKEGRLDEAMIQYLKAADIKPQLARIHENVANVLTQQRHFDQALSRITHALSINPDSATGQNSLAVILLSTNRIAEAETPSRRSVELDPENIEARGNLGVVLLNLGKFDEAVEHLSIVSRAAPSRYGVRLNLALALDGTGRRNDAIAELEGILRAAPTTPMMAAARRELERLRAAPATSRPRE